MPVHVHDLTGRLEHPVAALNVPTILTAKVPWCVVSTPRPDDVEDRQGSADDLELAAGRPVQDPGVDDRGFRATASEILPDGARMHAQARVVVDRPRWNRERGESNAIRLMSKTKTDASSFPSGGPAGAVS